MSASDERQALLADRAARVLQLQQLPPAMRALPQWLLWKLEEIPGRNGLQKVPYYANGARRHGELGGAEDLRCLVGFDAVVQRFASSLSWTGIGFAFLVGGGIIGVDLDDIVDPETGAYKKAHAKIAEQVPGFTEWVRDAHQQIVDACSSYTEWSPSGKGLHIIVAGQGDSFKHDGCGVEVYAGDRWFACTGNMVASMPADVQPIKPYALAYLREVVQTTKDHAARIKAAVDAQDAPAAAPVVTRTQPPGQAGNDFKRVNDAAYAAIDAWVPRVFAGARKWKDGYRVRSKDLGRDLEEDLQLTPAGIYDFGEEEGLSPIDTVMKWQPGCSTPKDALHWLAGQLGIALTPRGRPALRAVPKDGTGGGEGGEAPADESPAPPGDEAAGAPGPGGEGEASEKPARGGGKKRPPEFWDQLDYLRDNFALIYGTDTVWDGGNWLIMKIANMAHAHGSDLVKYWKGSKSCRLRSEGGRWTVMPENVVFDPTEQVDTDSHINLFRGFALEPQDGTVAPVLDLIRHLCSRAAEDPEDCDQVMHYLLCWMAYPLQKRGAKLRTAVVMHGDEGAGKNFLFDLLVEIYGEYGATVGQDELEDKFNDWRSRKLMVVGDEVSSRAELVHNKNRLKALITSTTVQINPKNLPRREEANHINVAFLSNELQPLALDNSDRRYLVIFTPKAKDYDFYAKLGDWKAKGGAAKFYKFLLEYECTAFDPYAPAPVTSAKRDLIDLNRKSPERFWLEWSEGQIDLPYWSCTVQQAYRAYGKYAQRTGDRFPVQQSLFTRMVLRISDTMGKPCIDKVMKVDKGMDGAPDPKATRMLLVQEPPPDVPQGVWATDCWAAFEKALNKYLGRTFGGGSDEGDPPM
jgi:putative DNA primase/helicase